MKRLKLLTSLFFLSIVLLGFGVAQEAFALKKIGDACTESNECDSNTCDDSYCTCGDTVPSNHCAQAYGGTAADWKCVDEDEDPDSSREEWNFCKKSDYLSSLPKTSTADVKYPVEKKLLMGQPCIDVDACLSGNGHGIDVCNETKLDSSPTPGDPLYDPWYAPGKKLNICTPPPDSMRAPDMCEYQYGPGDWDWNVVADTAGLELRGMRVCKKDGNPIMTTLAEMRKSAIKDVNSVETTFLGFDIRTEAPELVTPTTKIGIPGVFFTNITKATHITTDESGASWLNIPFLGEFIAAIYKYSVGLVSLIAVMVIIISGVQITTSAGNSEAISGAKHRIISSVIAIILTAGSYTILYTVNPELVNLRNLKILVVPGNTNHFAPSVEDENATSDYGVTTNPNEGTSPNTSGTNNKPAFTSTDPIRVYDPKGAGQYGAQYLANCSAFPNYNASNPEGAKARKECRLACIAQLPEEWKSKKAENSSYATDYLGAMDCSAQATRSLNSIKYIAIHEGGPGAIGTWWSANVRKQLPVGSHYFITLDGIIHQITDERFQMWHGVQNATSIGIDLSISGPGCAGGGLLAPEKVKDCNYTQAQYDSLNRLINEIAGRVGKRPTLLAHCEYGDGDHVDPRNFDWSKISGETNEKHRKKRCAYVPGYPFGVRP